MLYLLFPRVSNYQDALLVCPQCETGVTAKLYVPVYKFACDVFSIKFVLLTSSFNGLSCAKKYFLNEKFVGIDPIYCALSGHHKIMGVYSNIFITIFFPLYSAR